VGINTNTPNYTLDVNGEANVETTLTVPSITTLTGDDLNITAFSGRDVTISTTLATDPVTIVRNTAATGSGGIPVRTLTLRVDSTGTPVVGFGNQLEFETETTPGTTVQTGYINNQSTGDNAGVLDDFKMAFGVMSAGTSTTRMELDNLGNLQIDGDLQIDGNDLTTTQTTFNLLNTTATTVNAFGASTATNIGSTASGTTTIGWDAVVNKDLAVNGGDITTTQVNGNLFNANATTINIGNGATSQVNIGNYTSGTVNIKSQSLLQNDLGGAISTTFNLFNTITTDLNIGGAATAVDIGSTVSGTTTIGYDLVVNNGIYADFVVVDNQAALDSSTLTTTSTGTPLELNVTARNAMTGLINIIQGTNVHCLNYTALRIDATTAMLTTYAEMYNNISLGSFTADVSGGNLRLLVNPTSATSTVFSVVRTSLT
jgi:hypothetical protein